MKVKIIRADTVDELETNINRFICENEEIGIKSIQISGPDTSIKSVPHHGLTHAPFALIVYEEISEMGQFMQILEELRGEVDADENHEEEK